MIKTINWCAIKDNVCNYNQNAPLMPSHANHIMFGNIFLRNQSRDKEVHYKEPVGLCKSLKTRNFLA